MSISFASPNNFNCWISISFHTGPNVPSKSLLREQEVELGASSYLENHITTIDIDFQTSTSNGCKWFVK